MIRKLALMCALAATAAMSAGAQTPPADSTDRVVIDGQRIEDAVRDFVAEVGAPPKGKNLARWDGTICTGAVNITPQYAQRLIDQVSAVALAVGLEIGEPGCKPNVLILASPDGDALAAQLVKEHFQAFLPPDTEGNDLGRKALRAFETSDAPVRWWHVTQTINVDTGQAIVLGKEVTVRSSGRLRNSVREDMSHVVIVLDTSRIGTVSIASLADYISMIALAQVDADADTRAYKSILNLFASDDRMARMTQWDLDYLVALHAARGDSKRRGGQEGEIATQMLKLPSTAPN